MDFTRETNPQMSQHSTAESEAFEMKVPGTPFQVHNTASCQQHQHSLSAGLRWQLQGVHVLLLQASCAHSLLLCRQQQQQCCCL
jgi:hypothetical protein